MKKIDATKGKNSPIIKGDATGSHFGDNYFDVLKNKSIQVVTITDLILLIGEKTQSALREDTEKDLVEKLDKRFPSYKKLFSERYAELLDVYSLSYNEAKKHASVNDSVSSKITLYLKGISRNYLEENNNNPIEAINNMVKFFSEELDKRLIDSEKGVLYDHCAVEYYLYTELINCNIFPNPIN